MSTVKEGGTDIRRIDGTTAVASLVIALLIWGLLWYVLDRWTDSPVPLWDGLITSLSVVATWMLTRKYFEMWYVWIVANAIAVVVYLIMGMYPTAVLFMVYFGMAIVGVRAWSRQSEVKISPQSAIGSLQS
ncbi:MAG: nicotinamide riboside transporter PnuC [Bacteroidales bacterium]